MFLKFAKKIFGSANDRFISKLKPIIEEKKVREFKLFTSIDTWDKGKAEYIRNGLDVELFGRNLNKYLTY